MEQEQLIKKLKKALEKQPIRLAYLYGSYATGKIHPKSDIDVAVVFNPGVRKMGYEIATDLQTALGPGAPEVDVRDIDLNTEPVFLANVLNPAKPIFIANEKERIKFEVAAFRKFYDSQHLANINYYYLVKSVKEDTYGRGRPNYQKTT